MTAPIHIGSTKQLFLDDHVVDSLDNVVRQFHRPVRSPENPIIQADRPWERGGGGVYLFGGSVLYDEEDGHFKMWYPHLLAPQELRHTSQSGAGGRL